MYLVDLARELRIAPPRKVIHIGANVGQEAPAYAAAGIDAHHVEAIPEVFAALSRTCAGLEGQVAVNACLDEISGKTVSFNVTNNLVSSSLLPLGRHAAAYPDVVVSRSASMTTRTVDEMIAARELPADPDVMVIDVQGAEMRVLGGALGLLRSRRLWGLVVEVSLDPLYEDGARFESVYLERLKPFGYFLKSAIFNESGWTDAIFLKRWWRLDGEPAAPIAEHAPAPAPEPRGVNIAPRGVCHQSSLSRWSRGPNEAVDAVREAPTGGYSFHTDIEDQPWWMIDFGSEAAFDEVRCYNRLDAASERAAGLIVEISSDGDAWRTLGRATGAFGGVDGAPFVVGAPGSRARWLRLRLPRRDALHLDAVEIYDWSAG